MKWANEFILRTTSNKDWYPGAKKVPLYTPTRTASGEDDLVAVEAYMARRRSDGLRALYSHDEGRMHLSIAYVDRTPQWKEIAEARYALLPDEAEFAIVLPSEVNYVNLHPYTIHLWEMHDPGMPIERDPTGFVPDALKP